VSVRKQHSMKTYRVLKVTLYVFYNFDARGFGYHGE
jgi:hypothetical protein